jgi:hypothetical protein
VTPEANDRISAESRLAALSSVAAAIASEVGEVILLRAERTPNWLTNLGVPPGWEIRHLVDRTVEPSRIAVCGRRPDGGSDGSETISVFGFTGIPSEGVVRNNADCTLRDLAAVGIVTQSVDTPALPAAIAMRSSGYFEVAGLRLWAQYSIYVIGSEMPGEGRLIEHAVFVEAGCQARLSGDVAELTQAVYRALAATAART